jgi:hypothetical protein
MKQKRLLHCGTQFTSGCGNFYNESDIDKDPHFICPKCGRLGLRMEEYNQQSKQKEPIYPMATITDSNERRGSEMSAECGSNPHPLEL